ncbi:MAG TPA: hypothetical protein VLX09_25360 [Stellaceae bacterium]|nr:hypothetical protein [Stellaceae bacterium]
MSDESDPFDPARLRLDPSYAESLGVKKVLSTVPVRKPNRHDFIRVCPDPEYRLSPAGIVELKAEREVYLFTPQMAQAFSAEITPVSLRTAVNRQGVVFLWPLKLPDPQGRQNAWNDSAIEAAALAEKRWVRVTANMGLGAYETFEAINDNLPEPEWPSEPFQEILRIAFRSHIVDRPDHPLLKRLRGDE